MNVMALRAGLLYRGTAAELALEDAVAELGVPYRFQFPGYLYGFRYFPDFLLPTLGVVIEVDDPSHAKGDAPEKDAERTEFLRRAFDWVVVRCTNREALEDPRGAVARMMRESGRWPVSRPRRVRDALPDPKRCPQKERRREKSETRASRRKSAPRRRRQSGPAE